MQFLNILRGCGLTYLVAVVAIAGSIGVTDGIISATLFWTVGVIGLVLALPYILYVSVIWLILARFKVRAHWWHAALIGCVTFAVSSLLGMIWDDGESGFALAILSGAAFGGPAGAVFWFGAFGTQRTIVMGDPPP